MNAFNWHWLFWLPGIATVVAAIGAVLFVPQSPARSRGIDQLACPRCCCPAGWCWALLVLLSEWRRTGAGAPPTVLGLFAAAVLLAAAWVWSELRGGHPADRHEDDAPPVGLDFE